MYAYSPVAGSSKEVEDRAVELVFGLDVEGVTATGKHFQRRVGYTSSEEFGILRRNQDVGIAVQQERGVSYLCKPVEDVVAHDGSELSGESLF